MGAYVSSLHAIFTARKRSLGQGNVFTGVCHSVLRGVGFPACITGHMTRGVCIQGEGDLPPEGLGRRPRPSDTMGYGRTHFTGMHSCWPFFFEYSTKAEKYSSDRFTFTASPYSANGNKTVLVQYRKGLSICFPETVKMGRKHIAYRGRCHLNPL